MSLRLRLTLILGVAFVVVWTLAATWMYQDLRTQMMFSLDQRLAASARMVASLVDQLPEPLSTKEGGAHFSANQLVIPDGMACEVSSLRGEILASSHGNVANIIASANGGFHDQEIDGEHWRTFTLVQGDVRITTADREQERESLNHSVLLSASVPVLVALLACVAMLWLGIGKGLSPLKRMRDELKKRNIDSLEPLQLRMLPNELQPLLETQNHLLVRISQAVERERRLTGDAAHELRSPLTAIKTHLQVAQMTSGEARELALVRAEQGTDRLHNTLEQLLLLARVEGSLSFEDGSQCNVEQAVSLAIQDTGSSTERIQLSYQPMTSSAALDMPSVLAVAALRNLLDNALRHSPADTQVVVRVTSNSESAFVSVRNASPGMSEDSLRHMTERFWRSSSSTGCGLGLAIVQAIVQRCGCTIDFNSTSQDFVVTLGLPYSRRV
ncbi:ATP-binding protein [Pseudomonas lijiangensis]|uniref:histidine kinase n=1 Tax=Pseudomonas lijiangensis TaxID=2995658 RepID=A0ABX8HK62_9PSED|nr:ATP-binding protein [Pseudomonas lijiangensis]MBX8498418.1 sensor histidine kinase N-terminal domain-containing protein [Pseudomonas lijiangensis]MBX8503325.1 sensor histidine kinase N-terminal domain-containing protein [Pseudomonas lijiangensis]MBX8568495.1 sensor histidine kinase N-terminal domain-containing protein [Pseudomonas cichorii]QWU81076.1 sensor histidine kinase N-terminal domain-containing protein [Pseudomonas lijiangensis]